MHDTMFFDRYKHTHDRFNRKEKSLSIVSFFQTVYYKVNMNST